MGLPTLEDVRCTESYLEELPAIASWLDAISSKPEDDEATVFSAHVRDTKHAPSIDRFLARICGYSGCSPRVFGGMCVYILRYSQCTGRAVTRQSLHRLVLSAFVLAHKYMDDEPFAMSFYAQLGGVAMAEIVRMEREMILGMDWSLEISPTDYSAFVRCLRAAAPACDSDDEGVEAAVAAPVALAGERLRDLEARVGSNDVACVSACSRSSKRSSFASAFSRRSWNDLLQAQA